MILLLISLSLFLSSNTVHVCSSHGECHDEQMEDSCKHKGPSHQDISEGFCDPQDIPVPEKGIAFIIPLLQESVERIVPQSYHLFPVKSSEATLGMSQDFPKNSIQFLS